MGHAIDYTPILETRLNSSRASSGKFKEAFERGLIKYEAAGYARHTHKVSEQQYSEKGDYYFSTNPRECFASIMELLFCGTCTGKEVLVKYFSECIEIAKEMLEETQQMPDEKRFRKRTNKSD